MTFVAVLATYFRHLILRHREYNGDISLVPKIDLQGRSDDPTEAFKLGSFSFVIDSSIIFKIWYFVEFGNSPRIVDDEIFGQNYILLAWIQWSLTLLKPRKSILKTLPCVAFQRLLLESWMCHFQSTLRNILRLPERRSRPSLPTISHSCNTPMCNSGGSSWFYLRWTTHYGHTANWRRFRRRRFGSIWQLSPQDNIQSLL